MSLLELSYSIQFSAPLIAMRSSPWFFPVIATFHLLGLAVIGGAVLLVDLRLLGLGLRTQPFALDDGGRGRPLHRVSQFSPRATA